LKTKAETAELNNFKDDDLSVIDTKIAESDEDMDYFKSLAES
jgi:hypothetical protein